MNAKLSSAADYANVSNLASVLKIWPRAADEYRREQRALSLGRIGDILKMTDQERRAHERNQADHLHNSNTHRANCEELYEKLQQLIKALRLHMPEMARKVRHVYTIARHDLYNAESEFDWTPILDELDIIGVEAGILTEQAVANDTAPSTPAVLPNDKDDETKVRDYLQLHSDVCSDDEVVARTGVSGWHLGRMAIWKEHKNGLLKRFIEDRKSKAKRTGLQDVEQKFKWSSSRISEMPAWTSYREEVEPKTKGEVPIKEATLQSRPDTTATTDTERMERRDELFRAMVERADQTMRGRLFALKSGPQEKLMEYLIRQFDGHTFPNTDATSRITAFLQAADAWLEEHEQETRRNA